jgi:arylsulfatase A-like enzyme
VKSSNEAGKRFVLSLAALAALTAGLAEGIGLSLLRWVGGLTWEMQLDSAFIGLLWVAPALYLVMFLGLGFLLIGVGRLFSGFPLNRVAVFLFTLMLYYDVLWTPRRIAPWGAFAFAVGLAVVTTRWFIAREAISWAIIRKGLPVAVGCALLAFVGVEGGVRWHERAAIARLRAAPEGSPNILFIILDTLRADHLSSYGYARPTSPFLDQLAARGVVFENAISPSSWTLPAHASMLTGRYPHEHGAQIERYDGRYETLAQELLSRGYVTAVFSANPRLFTRNQGFGRGFIRFEDYPGSVSAVVGQALYGRLFYRPALLLLGREDIPGRKRASSITHSASQFIQSHPGKPFFAVLNYFDMHDPYLPPQPYRNKFSKIRNPGGLINGYVGRDFPVMTPEQFQGEIDAYDGALAYVDDAVRKLVADLEEQGIAKNTIIVITSDHGESFGDHGLLGHGNALYWDTIHVPLIVHWPGHVPAGTRVPVPVTTAALPATLMELIAGSQAGGFPGPSLVRLWVEPSAGADWPAPISELAHMPFQDATRLPNYHGAIKSLVSSQWHFIDHEKFGVQIYAWQTDPAEKNNIAGTAEGTALKSELSRLLRNSLRTAQVHAE